MFNRPGIASMSLGRPWIHDLPGKLMQAAAHGFEGIELFFDDLDCYAQRTFNGDHMEAARQTRRLCERLGMTIICLQPFSMYEGLIDRAESDRLINEKLPKWFTLARALGTDMIQVPSNFLGPDPTTGAPRTTGDRTVIVRDLQRLADLANRRLRQAYLDQPLPASVQLHSLKIVLEPTLYRLQLSFLSSMCLAVQAPLPLGRTAWLLLPKSNLQRHRLHQLYDPGSH